MFLSYRKEFDSPFYLVGFIELSCKRLQPTYAFLHEYYVKKGLIIDEIVAQSVFSRTTIVKYISIYGLQRKKTKSYNSLKSIKAVLSYHELGYTTRKIANILNKKNVPTLSGRGKWNYSSVAKLIRKHESKCTSVNYP